MAGGGFPQWEIATGSSNNAGRLGAFSATWTIERESEIRLTRAIRTRDIHFGAWRIGLWIRPFPLFRRLRVVLSMGGGRPVLVPGAPTGGDLITSNPFAWAR